MGARETDDNPISLSSNPLHDVQANALALLALDQEELTGGLKQVDRTTDGVFSKLFERNVISRDTGELTPVPYLPNSQADQVLVVGLGKPENVNAAAIEKAILLAVRKVASREGGRLAIDLTGIPPETASPAQLVELTATSEIVGAAFPGDCRATPDLHALASVELIVDEVTPELETAAERGRILGHSINLTRELVNRHPEDMVPKVFAERAKEETKRLGVKCEIWGQSRLEKEKMGCMLAVSRGSDHEPQAVFLRYHGANDDSPTLAICGKGVTFDSGGLSLKPSPSMVSMKSDMAGAATALGAIVAIAQLKLPVNVMVGIGLVENMIGPHSYKLGEILTARNGKTVEVHNTDAEGRLVLADILSYVSEQKPAGIIDLATLTGSCVVALGEDITGAFANNQNLCDQVLSAAKRASEDVWQMPMLDAFNEQLKSDFADMKNVGTKWGGAITAAKFLERFVDEVPWVHLDIAGPSFTDKPKPWRDAGGTGAMVKTLVELAAKFTK